MHDEGPKKDRRSSWGLVWAKKGKGGERRSRTGREPRRREWESELEEGVREGGRSSGGKACSTGRSNGRGACKPFVTLTQRRKRRVVGELHGRRTLRH